MNVFDYFKCPEDIAFPLRAKQAASWKGIKQLQGFGFDISQTQEQAQWPVQQS